MKNNIYKIIVIACLAVGYFSLSKAQTVTTHYFLENVPTRHFFNPAFQPVNDVYVSLPVLGFTEFGVTNNSLMLSDVVYKDPNNHSKSILFLNPYGGNKNKFYKQLRPTTTFRTDLYTNILGFGFRTNEAYWTFSLGLKVDGQARLPKDLFSLGLYGTPRGGKTFDLVKMGGDYSVYGEAALGYSRELNDQWTVGGKLKFLYGLANVSTNNDRLDLRTGMDKWNIYGSGSVNISSPIYKVLDDKNEIDLQYYDDFSNIAKPAGLGGGIDLGATYKPIEPLTISASITDLGFIRWNRNAINLEYDIDYDFEGFFNTDTDLDAVDMSDMLDSIFSAIEDGANFQEKKSRYSTMTSPKLNIGAEYAFWDHRLSVGLLSRTMFYKKSLQEEITAAFNIRPIHWFNLTASYSLLNGRYSTFGAGIGLKTLCFNWHISADYVPVDYAKYTPDNSSVSIPIPYKSKGLNLAFGLNIVVGKPKRDKDKDGVIDKLDLCPDTPKGVIVDANGCPVDSDGDGVPDYLDHCPDTPLGVTVDANGCPVDTDGDGVPDYLDKCPDTPAGIEVHFDGCPHDSDGDGVFDYLDECPGTPAEAYGMVDEHGCPIDSDNDGVPDYLDKCPNTPYGVIVDSNGCPIDTDGDGVPDYLDECPGTPAEAYGYVDEKGCLLDTDGDGVPDYIDRCSHTPAGVPVDEYGCPELQKEVRSLFQKALQGIQFETGKSIIKKSSHVILDQIAQVMFDNPTYLIAIQGHTDNVGKKESNQILSQDRANSVMKYLVDKGVASERMTAAGFGDNIPVAPNTTAAGRAKNRRVEFVVSYEEVKRVNVRDTE